MYRNRAAIGGFFYADCQCNDTMSDYWSSSEGVNYYDANITKFNFNNFQYDFRKVNSYRVRAVRSF